MMGSYGWMGAFGGSGMLIGLLVWLVVIALLVWGISNLFPRQGNNAQSAALEILKRRFAAGEIDAAEFETARRALA